MSAIRIIRQEAILLLIMALIGVLFLPTAIYIVGAEVFGSYAGAGFGEFYREIHSALRTGQPVIVFLLFSPYIIWQLVRLTFVVFFRMAPARATSEADKNRAKDGT